ncbi:MAG: hypothetical protein V3S55_00655 [Nitrospiraceae bacterium]
MKLEIRTAVIVGGVIASGLVFLLFIPAEGLPTQNAPVFFAAALAVNASMLIAVEISGSALLRSEMMPAIYVSVYEGYLLAFWISLLVSAWGLLVFPQVVGFVPVFFVLLGWGYGAALLILSVAWFRLGAARGSRGRSSTAR